MGTIFDIIRSVFSVWSQYKHRKMKTLVLRELEQRQRAIDGALAPTIEDIACWLNTSPDKIRPAVEDLVKDVYLVYSNGIYYLKGKDPPNSFNPYE